MINYSSSTQIYNIMNFTIRDMTNMGKNLRTISDGADSFEEASGRIVNYLYNTLRYGASGEKACALVRLFITAKYEKLTAPLQDFAGKNIQSESVKPDMKCLTLMGTVGDEAEWSMRNGSKGHQAIPLPSEEVVNSIPMIRNLVRQLGLDVKSVINPDPGLLIDMEQKTYNVFFVPDAIGSANIPAQKEFVIPYGIKSVLGFGGLFPSGEMFVVILFLKTGIPVETAEFFKSLSLNIKVSLLGLEDVLFSEKEMHS